MRAWASNRWSEMDRGQRVAAGVLAGLLAVGVGLRLFFMFAYRPALLGYPDTAVYITGARGDLFWDPMRVSGYPAFLRVVHAVNDNLSFTTVVQHALGVAAALLLYAAVRRIGGPPWVALVPAAVVLLSGDEIFFEHALISEPLYTFLTAAAVYAAVRCLDGGRWWVWPAAAGAFLALATTVRLAGMALLVLGVLWLLLVPAQRHRERLLRAGAAAAVGAAILFAYLVAAHDDTGRWSFARNGGYNFYGRAATFADCSEFDPPAGTRVLCEKTPPSKRPSAQWYIFSGPAAANFGEPQVGAPPRENVEKVSSFGRRAAIHQPFGWLAAAGRDFIRYVSPGSFKGPIPTPTTEEYVAHVLTTPKWVAQSQASAAEYWSTSGALVHRGPFERLRDYASVTRLEGVPLAVLIVLALVAPFACRGRERLGVLLVGGVGLALLVVPVVTINYDGRFAVPSYGFLAGAAGLGGLRAVEAVRRRRAATRVAHA